MNYSNTKNNLFIIEFLLIIITQILIFLSSKEAPPAVAASPVAVVAFHKQKFDSTDGFLLQTPPDTNTPPTYRNQTILLTPDPTATVREHQLYNVGRLLYNHTLPFTTSLSFTTSFTFQILTTTAYNNSGDGLAFTITSDAVPPPNSTGRYLGLASQPPISSSIAPRRRKNPFFAVEFDTFQNLEPDIVDPSASHLGVDVNSLRSVAVLDTSPASPRPDLFLYKNYIFTAWVDYNASDSLIQIWLANQMTEKKPAKPCLSVRYNLSAVLLPEMYVGISAASGNNSQGTVLYSWSFAAFDPAVETAEPSFIIVEAPSPSAASTAGITEHLPKSAPAPAVWLIAFGATGAGTFTCIFCALLFIGWRKLEARRRRGETLSDTKILPILQVPPMMAAQRYSYKELKRASQSFSEREKVGHGAFSNVYKGLLQDGSAVAVKRLKDGLLMEAEIAREVQIISQIRHRNLLQLQGWCYERGEALLVYQFMRNGSLDNYLYGEKKADAALDGRRRFKILGGVAAALEYLHGGLGDCVLHRDVKAANVLLTDSFEAMLGDFGLARLIRHDQVVTMTAAGTPGYVAPEVVYTGKATDKADVYSFGVLALEVACGRRALDTSLGVRLVDWVWILNQSGEILEALDPDLDIRVGSGMSVAAATTAPTATVTGGDAAFDDGRVWRCVLHLGLLCTQACPDARPPMRHVHQALQDVAVLPLPTSMPLYPQSLQQLMQHHSSATPSHGLAPIDSSCSTVSTGSSTTLS